MTKSNAHSRALWLSCLLIATAYAPSCAKQTPASDEEQDLEVADTEEALTQAEFDCELTKRECLIAADCDIDGREACESAFHACKDPLRIEKMRVRELCHGEREICDAAATDDAARHACHVAEHRCKLPVDPPEAACHITALECKWAARTATPPVGATEESCRAQEHECRESTRLRREDLPHAPKCSPRCPAVDPVPPDDEDAGVPDEVAAPEEPVIESQAHLTCERTKRECLIAADCNPVMREACESAFHACEEAVRAEKKRVRELCRAEREICEASAADEAACHACHIAEHWCRLPVEPPEAICRIEAEECRWAARATVPPGATNPPGPSAAEQACRETERECRDAKRVHREELPKPPRCPPPVPPASTPEPMP